MYQHPPNATVDHHGSEGTGQQWLQSQRTELNSSFAFQINVVHLDVYFPRNLKPKAITINTAVV